MADRDYILGVEKFPEQIELCGVCGRRVHRMPPDATRRYCENCGHADEQLPAAYIRKACIAR